MSGVIVVVVPIVHGTLPPGTYRALVWALAAIALLFLAVIAVWGYMGFVDWLRRRR